jgi:hypothetical protein
MKWLESHVWLAALLSLPIGLIGIIVQNVGTNFERLDWNRALIYLTLLTALAVSFTPAYDAEVRSSARGLLYFCLGGVIVDRKWRNTHKCEFISSFSSSVVRHRERLKGYLHILPRAAGLPFPCSE